MYSIKLKKGGNLIARIWDRKKKETYDRDVSEHLIYHLDDECDVEDGVTLRDVVHLATPHSDWLSPLVTKSKNLIHDISDAMTVKDDADTVLQYLVLSWHLGITNWNEDTDSFTERVGFRGEGLPRSDDPNMEELPKDQLIPYALSLTPANRIADLPIKFDKVAKIYDDREIIIDPPVLATVLKPFTVLDILKGIFCELTFFGGEEDKQKQIKSFEKTLKGISDGSIKTIPWDEVRKKIEEKLED